MSLNPRIKQKATDLANDMSKLLLDEGFSEEYIYGFLTGLDLAITSMKTIVECFEKMNDNIRSSLLISRLSHSEQASK